MVGLFINTVPVRVQLGGHEGVRSWLSDLQKQQVAVCWDISIWSWRRSREYRGLADLFDTLMVFENYPVGEQCDQ